MKVLSTSLLFFCFLFGISQELPNIVPPSPEVSALSKHTDVPVSYHTGLPNISVPIYTIRLKSLEVPISLNYHARGVKVEEIAPRTGMGWSLSYGGSLSRQTRGKADDSPGGSAYFAHARTFQNYPYEIIARQKQDGNEIEHPDYDFYPDKFTFSTATTGGNFVFDYHDLEPIIQSFDDVKISYSREEGSSGLIDGFIITDSQGNRYYYGLSMNKQRIGVDYQTSAGISVYYNNAVADSPTEQAITYSSWKLMDIETPYGEVVSYYYEAEYGNNAGTTYWNKVMDKHQTPQGTSPYNPGNMSDLSKIYSRVSRVTNYEKQLYKIVFNGGDSEIYFHKSNHLRFDYEGYALDRIEIKHQNKLAKAFKLNYTYTTSSDNTNVLYYFLNNPIFEKAFKRMFLSSVEQQDFSGNKLPPYQFTYNETPLPSRFSSRQDYWGYYNGATNNGPFNRMFEYGSYTPNRRVNIELSEAGLLKEIKYPTGGISKFTYEHNIAFPPLYVSELKLPGINPGSADQVQLNLTKDYFLPYENGSYQVYELELPYSTAITIRPECRHLQPIGGPEVPDCLFRFLWNGNELARNQDNIIYTPPSSTNIRDNIATITILTPRFDGIHPDLHKDRNYNFNINISYSNANNDIGKPIYGPGKRIKSIENIDNNGLSTFKTFDYSRINEAITTVEDDKITSGFINGLPRYINTKTNSNSPATINGYYDSSSSTYGSFQQNTIGYSHVTEYFGTESNNIGKIEYTFTSIPDSGGDYYAPPYHPPTDNSWLCGKLILKKVYQSQILPSSDEITYKPKTELYYKYRYGDQLFDTDFQHAGLIHIDFPFTPQGGKYDFDEDAEETTYVKSETVYNLPLFMRRSCYENGTECEPPYIMGYRIYYLTGGRVDLEYTIEKNYFDDNELAKMTTYSYNYFNEHYQPSTITTSASDGKQTITNFTYANDIPETHRTPAEHKLIDQNRVTAPVETRTKVTDASGNTHFSKSTQKTVYDVWYNNLVLPQTIQTLKGAETPGNLPDERIIFHDYDSQGNPLEVSKADGPHIVYIWGYNNTQPIAKIENASYDEVEEYVANLKSLSNNDNDRTVDTVNADGSISPVGAEGLLRRALSNLRVVLPQAQITTFTYDPLIGVTSITDLRGETIYYDYDDFNRLEFVKDANGNILSKNQYHYKDQ